MANTWPRRNTALTIRQEAEQVASYVYSEYAMAKGGVVEVMQSVAHLWEKIYEVKDLEPRIYVVFAGEQARGGFDKAATLHRTDRQWLVVVMRGHGFYNLMPAPGMVPVVEGGVANPPIGFEFFTDSMETIRDLVRGMTSISEEFPVDYKSMKPLQNVGPGRVGSVFLDAYVIEYSTAHDLPQVYFSSQD